MLQNIVRSKISRNSPVLRAVTKRLIVGLVNDEKLASKIGADLCSTIPSRLDNMGITAVATVVYQQSSYLCLEVDIASLNVRKFLEKSARGPGALTMYNKICDMLKSEAFENWVERLLTNIVTKKLMTSLPQTIVEKLQLKLTAQVELIACSDAEQGPFLISTMQELNTSKKMKADKAERQALAEKQALLAQQQAQAALDSEG
jgi:hypothetical protein